MNDAIRMQLSAYVDGELPDNEAELLLRRISQDADLRAEVAEYLAMGRMIRAELGPAGSDRLNERVSAIINDHESPVVPDNIDIPANPSRAYRPLAGAAIAATVALVAIFALQQNAAVDESPLDGGATVVDVVPSVDAQQERQRQYIRSHAETSSELGANGMNSRVVTLRFIEDLDEDSVEDDTDVDNETTVVDETVRP